MSTEEATPPASEKPADKAPVVKPTAHVSSFINKNTTGKKFVPKVARRRAAPAVPSKAPSAPAPEPPLPVEAPPSAETPQPVQPQAAPPTPAPTQDADIQDAPQTAQVDLTAAAPSLYYELSPPEPQAVLATPAPTQDVPVPRASQTADGEQANAVLVPTVASPTPIQAVRLPAQTVSEPGTSVQPRTEESTQLEGSRPDVIDIEVPPTGARLPRRVNEELQTGRSSKRQRTVEPPQDHETEEVPGTPLLVTAPTPTEFIPVPIPIPPAVSVAAPSVQSSFPLDPALENLGREGGNAQGEESAPLTVPESQADTTSVVEQEEAAAETSVTATRAPSKQPRQRRRRTVPWKAINQEQGSVEAAAGPSANTPSVTKPRGRRRAARATQAETEEGNHATAEEVQIPPQPVIGGEATENLADSGSKEWTPTAPPKKPRKPRKDKGQKRKAPDTQAEEVTEGNEANESGATEVERPAKKKRAPRRKKTTPANGANGEQVDGDGGGQDQTLRRRGRERETTPEDAEHHNVDPESTFLDSLASRNYRLGRMSEREKQMREVNWEEVKERRRKENALEIPRLKTREEKEAEAKAKEEAQHQAEQQRQRQVPNAVIVNGQIVVVAQENANGGGGDDGEGDIIEEGDVVEERDLTARITTNSFIRENKRFPREFMLAGQGKRWTAEMTERFYDALQIFGTDFNMIQTLFKDVTRRSIKLKFNREERENPAGIKAALNGQRKSNWEEFLRKGDYTEAHFKDPREMEAELAAMREEKREAIENVKARAAERRRQRKLAGLPEEEEEEGEDGEADKEGGKKKRKKRQAKTVQWQDEENVEIVGEVGDDEDQDL